MTVRVIPRLDIKGPNLVKGVHLEGLRVLGKPEIFAKHYYRQGADELLYVDVVASLYGRNSLLEFVERTAREIFVPLTVTGGLGSIADIREALRAGADKVGINTAAVEDPTLIEDAAEEFGSSTIVVSIEAIEGPDGTYEAFMENGREPTGREVVEWACEAEKRGAGEILLTSVDQEGTGEGYDLTLTRRVSEAVSIPVIACGGAGTVDHVGAAIERGRADAVSLATLLHYEFVQSERHLDIEERREGNIEYLKRGGAFDRVKPTPLTELKDRLRTRGHPIREVVGSYA